MKELLEDSLGMAGAVMIRRIIGIAHVQDFKHIDSDDQRWAHKFPQQMPAYLCKVVRTRVCVCVCVCVCGGGGGGGGGVCLCLWVGGEEGVQLSML